MRRLTGWLPLPGRSGLGLGKLPSNEPLRSPRLFVVVDGDLARQQARRINCEEARDAASARFDGEELRIAGEALDGHLQSCACCQAFEDQLASIGRKVRLTVARPVPADLVTKLTLAFERGAPAALVYLAQRNEEP